MTNKDQNSSDGQDLENAFFSDGYQLAKDVVGTEITTKRLDTVCGLKARPIDDFLEFCMGLLPTIYANVFKCGYGDEHLVFRYYFRGSKR